MLAELPETVIDRYHERVERRGPNDCWPWLGTIGKKGYGQLSHGRHRTIAAHRLGFFLATGEEPENVCHHCDNPPCQNPAHWFGGTSAENQHDKGQKGRAARGERNGGGGRLTEADVRAIRVQLAAGDTYRAIGEAFGVSKSEIGFIARGEHWSHVQ